MSTYRLELRSLNAWQSFGDIVGLPLAMQVLEELLPATPLAARVVRAKDGLPIVTVWFSKFEPPMGVRP
jgi:hypothetical protein